MSPMDIIPLMILLHVFFYEVMTAFENMQTNFWVFYS